MNQYQTKIHNKRAGSATLEILDLRFKTTLRHPAKIANTPQI